RESVRGSGRRVRVLGYTEEMRKLMAAADLLVTKAGGVSLAEAIACDLPVVCFGSLPGHERRNERFIVAASAALSARSAEELGVVVTRSLTEPGLLDDLAKRMREIRRPGAARAVAEAWPIGRALETPLFFAALARTLFLVCVIALCAVVRRRPRSLGPWIALVALTAAGTVSAAWISHAAGRLARGPLILTLDAVHQLAAGLWVGGLAHLLVLAWARASRPWPAETLQRFSRLAQGAVATLAAAAIGLWLLYIGGPGAALGTAYGAMTLTKGV